MKHLILIWCVISALVSSKGDVIVVDDLYKIVVHSGTVYLYQYANPSIIKTDWTLQQVEDSIFNALSRGCSEV